MANIVIAWKYSESQFDKFDNDRIRIKTNGRHLFKNNEQYIRFCFGICSVFDKFRFHFGLRARVDSRIAHRR